MYQSLIWRVPLRHQPGGLRAPVHAQDVERAPDSLIDRMRGDAKLNRNLFRRQVLIDQQERVQLPLAEPGDAGRRVRFEPIAGRSANFARILAICEIARHQHNWLFTGKDEFRQNASLNRFETALAYTMFT